MMKTLKKALSVFLAVALLACLCIGMGMTGYAAGNTITVETVGTYAESDAAQDVTIRISIAGLSESYCGFYIDGVTLPDGWTLKSYSTNNTAKPVNNGDFNPNNGKLTYETSDTSDTIPADTYYDAVITAPADVSGDFNIVFKNVICAKTYGTVELASAATVTANVTIKGNPDPTPDPTPDPNANGYTVTVKADKTEVATGGTVLISLDVANSVSTVTEFYVIDLVLTYENANFTYDAPNSILPSGLTATASGGELTIQRYGSAIALQDGAEFKLAFTADSAAENCEFKVTKAQIDTANNANQDAPEASVSGTPKVTVSQTYTVTYDIDGATGIAPTQDPVTSETKIKLPTASAFSKEGYTFAGWTCDIDNKTYGANDTYTMTAANTKFTAQWSKNYTVTYDINGATGTIPTQAAVPAETQITLPAATAFTYDGFTFAGWKCSADQKVYEASAPYTMTGKNTTFTAQWTENTPDPKVTVETIANYCDGYTLIKATIENADGNVPTYNEMAMFKVKNVTGKSIYDENAYYYVEKTADYDAGLVSYAKKSAVTITKDGDANQTGLIDINDAQFIYNLYNTGISVTYKPSADQLLASDVNGDGSIGSDDCAAAIDKIQ